MHTEVCSWHTPTFDSCSCWNLLDHCFIILRVSLPRPAPPPPVDGKQLSPHGKCWKSEAVNKEQSADLAHSTHTDLDKWLNKQINMGFPGGASGEEPTCQGRRQK